MKFLKYILITILFYSVIALICYLNLEKTKEFYSWFHLEKTLYHLKNKNNDFYKLNKDITNLYLVANKEQKKLYIYSKTNPKNKYSLTQTFNFTGESGVKGPKLKRGDEQIPEGIYKPNFLNSRSSYHLSIGINYPNDFDKKKGELDKRIDLGDEIFIHGRNVSIGCIPIGDENIEKLFLLVAIAGIENTTIAIIPQNLRVFPSIEGISWEDELYNETLKNINKNLNITNY